MRNCPVCNNHLNLLFKKNGYPIGDCESCHTLAVMNTVNQKELNDLYSSTYYEKDKQRYLTVTSKQKSMWLRRLRTIDKWQQEPAAGKHLLDIGCGTGVFLSIAQDCGWEVSGIEISEEASKIAVGRLGRNTISHDIFALDETESLDVITMWAVIEHMFEPLVYLNKVHSLLKTNGLLVIATMNTNSWNRNWFKNTWRYFTPPEHLVYFNIENLKMALRKTGFQSLYEKTIFNESAFWQSFQPDFMHNNSLSARIIKKFILKPLKISAGLLQGGDIIEMLAVKK